MAPLAVPFPQGDGSVPNMTCDVAAVVGAPAAVVAVGAAVVADDDPPRLLLQPAAASAVTTATLARPKKVLRITICSPSFTTGRSRI